MSKLTALITTLVLGASSVAMAQPSSFHARSSRFDDRFDRDQRFDRRDLPRRYRSSWVSLAEPMHLSRGRDTIDVNLRGTFTQLRLQTAVGTSYIERVIVRFADGSRQVVEVRRAVDPYHRMLQFLLDGNNRRIDRIVVIGRSHRDAAIQVFGI
jgi:hypothetical protein